jgi:O-antigen/teichoic acid export membrane protein
MTGDREINIKQSAMRGLKWVTLSRIIAQGLTWANTFFVIRLISQEDFGLAALAAVFANFLSLLNELGFSVALIQRQTRDEETLRNVFGALLVVGALLTVGLVACAPLVGIATHEPRVVPLVRLIALQFVSMSFSVIPQARLSMDMRFKEIGIAGVISAVLGGAATLIFALNGAGAWGLIVGTVTLSLSRAALLNVYCPSLRIPQFHFSKIRGFARFSGLVLIERSLWYWYMQIDSFVVARSLGAAQLGIYAVGRQLTNIPLERAMEIINAVALPTFSAVKDDRDRVRQGYLKVLRIGAGYAFPVFWGLALVCDPLVRLVIGPKWLEAVPVIQLLCVAMPLRMLNSFTAAAVTSVGRQDVNIKSLLFAIVVIPGCILVGRQWGVVGVAAAWAIGFPFVYLLNATLIHRALELEVSSMVTAIWPPAVASALMVAILVGLDRWVLGPLPPYVQLSVGVLAGALVFVLALWLLSRRTAVEIFELARGMLPGRA